LSDKPGKPENVSEFDSCQGHYNGDSTGKTGQRQAEDIMDEQHYCMDWDDDKCYNEEDRG